MTAPRRPQCPQPRGLLGRFVNLLLPPRLPRARSLHGRRVFLVSVLIAGALVGTLPFAARAESPAAAAAVRSGRADEAHRWTLASDGREAGAPLRVYVEAEKRPGNPAFRVETEFEGAPALVAATLMTEMIGSKEMPKGQTRTVIERREREVVVQTLIDLPMMFSDREVAVRIQHSDDQKTGIHRIDFKDANEFLPPAEEGVVRLSGTDGYWEFKPSGAEGTLATYVTRASVGGSIPAALGDRLLKAQAIDSVSDLRDRLARSARPSVAAPPAQ